MNENEWDGGRIEELPPLFRRTLNRHPALKWHKAINPHVYTATFTSIGFPPGVLALLFDQTAPTPPDQTQASRPGVNSSTQTRAPKTTTKGADT